MDGGEYPQPVKARMGACNNVEKPEGAPDWNTRLQFQIMSPKKTRYETTEKRTK